MKKQEGFALISAVLIVLTIVGFGSVFIAEAVQKKRIIKNAEFFYNRVLYLQKQLHAYANDKYIAGININSSLIFPSRLSHLEGSYVTACSTADNDRGLCMKVDQAPWGQIGYEIESVINESGDAFYYRAVLDIPLPSKTDETLRYERNTTISMLAQLPNIEYDDARNMIKLIVDRPDKAFGYESLVKRSGESTLLDDWDAGGLYAITNVRDITIRNSDGTQKLVSRGLSNVYTVKHGSKIFKPSCPTKMVPQIALAISSIDFDISKFRFGGKVQAWFDKDKSTEKYWIVGLDYLTWDEDRKGVIQHGGKITATTSCKG